MLISIVSLYPLLNLALKEREKRDGSRKFNLVKGFQSMNYCLTSLAIHPENMYLEGTLAPDALGL